MPSVCVPLVAAMLHRPLQPIVAIAFPHTTALLSLHCVIVVLYIHSSVDLLLCAFCSLYLLSHIQVTLLCVLHFYVVLLCAILLYCYVLHHGPGEVKFCCDVH